jgi:hypothetical protein
MQDAWASALAGVVFGTGLPWLLKALWRALRGEVVREQGEIDRLASMLAEANELVDLLRRALDKHMIRESAIAGTAELLIAVIKLVPDPTDAMLHVLGRAEEVLDLARQRIAKINRGEA